MSISFRIPKMQIVIALLCIYITAFFYTPSLSVIITLLSSVLSAIFADFIFLKIRKKPFFFPSAAIVTGLIVALLTSPTLPLYEPIIASVAAIGFKNFIRITNRHIFNPAAVGILLTAIIFDHSVSWWAVSWQQLTLQNIFLLISFFILLSPGYVSVMRMKRWRIIVSFFILYVLVNPLVQSNFSIIQSFVLIPPILFDVTTLFFILVMLPEPMTSPNNRKRQIYFGLSVATIVLVVSLTTTIFPLFALIPDVYIFSLLLTNLIFFKLR